MLRCIVNVIEMRSVLHSVCNGNVVHCYVSVMEMSSVDGNGTCCILNTSLLDTFLPSHHFTSLLS